MTTEIIDQLGLTHTSSPTTAAMPDPHPTAYVPGNSGATNPDDPPFPFDNTANPPTVVNEVNPSVPAGGGAMISTVDDLRRWTEELFTGTLLTPETQAERLETQLFAGQANASYGLAILKVGQTFGHDGAILGYSTVGLHYPAAGATFVAVSIESTNSTTPTTNMVLPIIKTLYPEATQG
jgi:D-alanyl-D-alanine carboxypeptidase